MPMLKTALSSSGRTVIDVHISEAIGNCAVPRYLTDELDPIVLQIFSRSRYWAAAEHGKSAECRRFTTTSVCIINRIVSLTLSC